MLRLLKMTQSMAGVTTMVKMVILLGIPLLHIVPLSKHLINNKHSQRQEENPIIQTQKLLVRCITDLPLKMPIVQLEAFVLNNKSWKIMDL